MSTDIKLIVGAVTLAVVGAMAVPFVDRESPAAGTPETNIKAHSVAIEDMRVTEDPVSLDNALQQQLEELHRRDRERLRPQAVSIAPPDLSST